MTLLWEPGPWEASRLGRLARRIEERHGVSFGEDPEALHAWTVAHPADWWREVWVELALPADPDPATGGEVVALEEDPEQGMVGARWFPEVRLSYAEAVLAAPGRDLGDEVVVSHSQSRPRTAWTLAELRADVARVRAGLERLGVGRGDRVAAYAPNIGETFVLLLATASLGAVFCSVAPEFGTQSVLDRLGQVEPRVLVAVDGYRYGDKPVDRSAEVAEVCRGLPGTRLVHLPYLDPGSRAPAGATTWAELAAPLDDSADEAMPPCERVPYDHPLYVLFSSGTTGLPKPIVHGHGGIALGHAAAHGLFTDLGPGDRFSWFSTTGWMMWNYLVSGLLVGSTVVLFDGDPAHPDLLSQWRLASDERLTVYGTSAPFLMACRKAGLRPADELDLSALRFVGSTGAPLPAEGALWVHLEVSDSAQVGSLSGGTDICNGFVGATPLTPVRAGEIAGRYPGFAVETWVPRADGSGWDSVVGETGELVITRPMPCAPVGLWGDEDGSRLRAAWYDDIPGVWRHGDWAQLTERGSIVISGRSDATLNRGGVRLGTSEFYRVVEELPSVRDSLVVHLEDEAGGPGELVLFVVPAGDVDASGAAPELDAEATEALRREVAGRLRSALSPRHVPDTLHVVRRLPRTLSGKRLEVPVKRILRGADPETVTSVDALDDPDALRALAGLVAPA